MIGEPYPFLNEDYNSEKDILFFTFLSQGEEVIPKAVGFVPIEKDEKKYYNWGFGNLVVSEEDGSFVIDDKAENNNGDVKAVFYTVVSTLTLFFNIHPEAIVHITGSNRQRTEVYRGLIRRHWNQIEPFYHVNGFINGMVLPFESDIEFEYLLISKKKL